MRTFIYLFIKKDQAKWSFSRHQKIPALKWYFRTTKIVYLSPEILASIFPSKAYTEIIKPD